MKKIIFALTILILTSCKYESRYPIQGKIEEGKCPLMYITEFTYKGHEYIYFHNSYQAGVVHNPECKKCLEVYD